MGPEISPVSIQDERRPLVLYIYAESENARANLEFFIKKALHGAADFFFVFNGETNATKLIPDEPNIKIIQRENRCFDLGTIGEVLLKDDLWRKYKRFITLNASIRGPFFPIYSSTSCWTDVFLDRVTEHVKVLDSFLYPTHEVLTKNPIARWHKLQLRSQSAYTIHALGHRRYRHVHSPRLYNCQLGIY